MCPSMRQSEMRSAYENRQGTDSTVNRRGFIAGSAALLASWGMGRAQTSYSTVSGQKLRDCLWLWGTLPNVHEETVKKISKITAVEAANYLGVKNIIMGGG